MAELLYHGSTVLVEHANLSLANPKRDFGVGFYTTSSYEQAVRFSKIVARRLGSAQGVVNRYSFRAVNDLVVLRFERADQEWLDFVLSNRRHTAGSKNPPNGDLIIGPVANDQVGRTLNLLATGAYGDPNSNRAKSFALSLLMPENLTDQWVFKTEKAVQCLEFLGADE
ncbi:MAG: DUF3990 domain-containing protein [Coriobacteriales bacterium]|jgi:hypothetical protein|nr:DUF3990 domain-containing protein [Coriobacteriales bacterium]